MDKLSSALSYALNRCLPATGCVRFIADAMATAAALDIEENGVGPNVVGTNGTVCTTVRLTAV